MAIVYPNGIDSFSVPSNPQATTLSSGGSSTRDHPQSHSDMGLAIMALEATAAQLDHDHSGAQVGIVVNETTAGMLASNDVQIVSVIGSPTGGTFTLAVGSYATANLPYNVTASALQTALQGLTGVGAGNVTVAGSGTSSYIVVFGGSLANTAVPTLTATAALTGGTSPKISVVHTTVGSIGVSEVQQIAFGSVPTGGTFTLAFNGQTTADLAYNTTATNIQTNLQGLSTIGSGNAAVTGSVGGPFTVTFQGTMADAPQALVRVTNNLTGNLFATNRLGQANTHEFPDTDLYPTSLHHTIGRGPFQAAAGNHAHDYNGPSIFNQPYLVVTSTSRPLNPFPGLVIWETDTNCARVWSSFEDNTLVSGLDYEYLFNSGNSATQLDPTIFRQTYPVGVPGYDGAMGAPLAGDCVWYEGGNTACRCIAQAVVEGASTFSSDKQEIQFVTGGYGQGTFGAGGKGSGSKLTGPQGTPTNDAYLRMSEDGQSYVRYAVCAGYVVISYTVSGPANEVVLGSIAATTGNTGTTWLCTAIGNTYSIYSNGQAILSSVDYNNVINSGVNYRGWGIGMQACVGEGAQYNPNSVASVLVIDEPTYTTELTWQLLNWGAVPHLRASANFEQEVYVTTEILLFIVILFFVIEWDWQVEHFMNPEVSQSDITIQEAGHYSIHAAVAWNPGYASFDHSMVGITVNGQDVGINNWQFGAPNGFGQTQDASGSYRFAKGDVVRVVAANNSSIPTYTYYSTGPFSQACYVELDFIGP